MNDFGKLGMDGLRKMTGRLADDTTHNLKYHRELSGSTGRCLRTTPLRGYKVTCPRPPPTSLAERFIDGTVRAALRYEATLEHGATPAQREQLHQATAQYQTAHPGAGMPRRSASSGGGGGSPGGAAAKAVHATALAGLARKPSPAKRRAPKTKTSSPLPTAATQSVSSSFEQLMPETAQLLVG
jgi:hypothetical protein